MTVESTVPHSRYVPDGSDLRSLIRAFTVWTGDPMAADDLAQETLYAAWRSDRQPEREDEWRPWLFGVARNILLRWRRDQARHGRRLATPPESERHFLAAATDDDIDRLLDRDDIVDLLDTALGRLPRETRQALLLKYIEDLPQAEIAARLGMHEKALEGRLHRGKRAIHKHLLTERADTAVTLGLVAELDTWVETDIWCPVCGKRRLHGRWYESGDLRLDCLECDNWFRPGERSLFFSASGGAGAPPIFPSGQRPSFRVAMERVSDAHHRKIDRGLESAYDCPRCDTGTVRPQVVRRPSEFEDDIGPNVRYECSTCGYCGGFSYVPGSGYRHPAILQWNERHERIRMLRPRHIEVSGRPSIETEWASVSGTGSATTVHDLGSLRLVRATVDGCVVFEGEPG